MKNTSNPLFSDRFEYDESVLNEKISGIGKLKSILK